MACATAAGVNVAMSSATAARWNGGPTWIEPRRHSGVFRRDADALRRWAEEFRPIVEEILVPEAHPHRSNRGAGRSCSRKASSTPSARGVRALAAGVCHARV